MLDRYPVDRTKEAVLDFDSRVPLYSGRIPERILVIIQYEGELPQQNDGRHFELLTKDLLALAFDWWEITTSSEEQQEILMRIPIYDWSNNPRFRALEDIVSGYLDGYSWTIQVAT